MTLRELPIGVEEPSELTSAMPGARPGWIEGRFEESFILTRLDWALNWGRASSLWPLTFGLACCAIEMMATGSARYDLDRFGYGAFRATPRQADLMIVAGTVTYKMADRVRRLYNQMAEPKYVVAMGACTIGGGPYYKFGYHVVKGVDLVIPVDVHVPGCPPRPEALIEGLLRLREKIERQTLARPAMPATSAEPATTAASATAAPATAASATAAPATAPATAAPATAAPATAAPAAT